MFKATITKSIELLEYNKTTKKYEGVDPDSHIDCDCFDIEAFNLDDLKNKITNHFGNKLDWFEEGDCYIVSCDLEYHHSVPKKERIPGIETYYIYITEVISTKINKPW